MGELVAFADRLGRVLDRPGQDRILHAIGGAGKKAALDAAARDLGADRAFSGLRRRAPLNAGYDLEADSVTVHLRPKGLWMLATTGRRRQGTILPRRRPGRRRGAVRTPQGLRALSHYSASRGLGTVDDAVTAMRTDCPRAAAEALADRISEVM
jgi:hypothetical protein